MKWLGYLFIIAWHVFVMFVIMEASKQHAIETDIATDAGMPPPVDQVGPLLIIME